MQQTDYKQILEETLTEFKSLLNESLTKEKNWKQALKEQNLSLEVHIKEDTKPALIRVDAEFDATPDEILACQTNLQMRKEMMDRCKAMDEIRKIDDDSTQYYWRMSIPMPFVDDRDFLVVYRIFREQDNSIFFIQKSVEDQSRPKVKGVTRGIVHQQGFYLQPLANNKTKLTNFGLMDMDLNPPQSMLVEMRSKQMQGLQKAIQDARKK